MKPIAGKVALVTGAGRGIAQAISLKLAAMGAHLVINDLDAEVLSETAAAIADLGGVSEPVVADVTSDGFAGRMVEAAASRFNGLDIIVNNAGFTWDAVIQNMSDDQFQAMLDVHLLAPFRLLRAAAPFIRERAKTEAAEGREIFRKVVNISSVSGLFGNPGQANYAAAKSGLIGLTRTLAKEWGRYKVNVNCVAFGVIESRLTRPVEQGHAISMGTQTIQVGVSRELMQAASERIALGRVGTAEEAASSVYLFCSPDSDYITGQVIEASGGLAL